MVDFVVVVVVGEPAVGFLSCGGPASVVAVEPTLEPSAVPGGNVTVVFPVVWACAGSANMSPVAIAKYVLRRIEALHHRYKLRRGFGSSRSFAPRASFSVHFFGVVVVVAAGFVAGFCSCGGPASVFDVLVTPGEFFDPGGRFSGTFPGV